MMENQNPGHPLVCQFWHQVRFQQGMLKVAHLGSLQRILMSRNKDLVVGDGNVDLVGEEEMWILWRLEIKMWMVLLNLIQ